MSILHLLISIQFERWVIKQTIQTRQSEPSKTSSKNAFNFFRRIASINSPHMWDNKRFWEGLHWNSLFSYSTKRVKFMPNWVGTSKNCFVMYTELLQWPWEDIKCIWAQLASIALDWVRTESRLSFPIQPNEQPCCSDTHHRAVSGEKRVRLIQK